MLIVHFTGESCSVFTLMLFLVFLLFFPLEHWRFKIIHSNRDIKPFSARFVLVCRKSPHLNSETPSRLSESFSSSSTLNLNYGKGKSNINTERRIKKYSEKRHSEKTFNGIFISSLNNNFTSYIFSHLTPS
jgi:hypothetical protein